MKNTILSALLIIGLNFHGNGQLISLITLKADFNYYESDYSEQLAEIIDLLEDHDRKMQELIKGIPEADRIYDEHQNVTTAHSLLDSYTSFTKDNKDQIERQVSKLDEAFDYLSGNEVVQYEPYTIEKLLRSSFVQELYRDALGDSKRSRRQILRNLFLPYLREADVEIGLYVEEKRKSVNAFLTSTERSRHEVCLGGGHGGWHEHYILYVSADSILSEANIAGHQRKDLLLERQEKLDPIYELVSSREILINDESIFTDRYQNLTYSISKVGKNRGCRNAHCMIYQYEARFRRPIFEQTEDQYFNLMNELYQLAVLRYFVQERIEAIESY